MKAIIQENNIITCINIVDGILNEDEFSFLVDIISEINFNVEYDNKSLYALELVKFINNENIKEL